jgi:selenocysteine lyase/cysteine desulfurase
MCCLARAAALYIADDLIQQFEPSYRFYWRVYEDFNWNSAPWDKPEHDNISSWDRPVVRTAEKFDPGCVGEDAQMGFHESLRFFNELGVKEVQDRDLKLSGYLLEGLKDLGVKIITPVEELSRAGIVTYTLGTYEANKRAYNAFKEAGIAVSHRYIGGVGGIRISPHFFNREEDIDEALITQKRLIDSCFGNSGQVSETH